MLKTYQFKTHCKGDSHSSKTANIISPGLMIKKGERPYSCKRNGIQIHWTALCWLKQLISPKLNSLSLLQWQRVSRKFITQATSTYLWLAATVVRITFIRVTSGNDFFCSQTIASFRYWFCRNACKVLCLYYRSPSRSGVISRCLQSNLRTIDRHMHTISHSLSTFYTSNIFPLS